MSELAAGSAGVASGHPLAAAAGIEALRAGGSAVDAALSAAFTQWVVNAPQCGPGGEMLALVAGARRKRAIDSGDARDGINEPTPRARSSEGRRPPRRAGRDEIAAPTPDEGAGRRTDDLTGTGDVLVYGGWSRVPLAIGDIEDPEDSGATDGRGWPATGGPRNAVVPGSLRGAEAVWRAHGRLRWEDLFVGASEAAAGHGVTPRMAAVYRQVEDRGYVEALRRLIGAARAPSTGATIRMPSLASTLAKVASGGADMFYLGEIAAELVASARREGAALCQEDLDAVVAIVEPAVRFDLDDIVVWVPGAPSQSPITPALLAAVAPDIDPASRSFAQTVAPLTEQHLTEFCALGPIRLGGTAVSTAVDFTGMSATVVHSLAAVQFGTGWVAGDTGVAFSNRVGTALSDRSDLPGCNPQPGALLPHTLSAAHVRRRGPRSDGDPEAAPRASATHDDESWMTVATPGGDRQVQWLAQAIQRYRLGIDPAEAASGPRWFVCPSGDRFGVPAGIGQPWYAFAEPGIHWRADKRLGGYEVRPVDNVGGGLQLVVATGTADSPPFQTASDPRSAGAALAL